MSTSEIEAVNAKEAAQELGVSYRTALRWLEAGKLEAEKTDGEWRIPRAEIERLAGDHVVRLEAYSEKATAADVLVELTREGYWRAAGDIAGASAEVLEAYAALDEVRDADPVVVEERHGNLEAAIGELERALEARRAYLHLAGEATRLRGEAIALGREVDRLTDAALEDTRRRFEEIKAAKK